MAQERINLSRSFCTTTKGYRHDETQITDKICILFGCIMPVVLREVEKGRYVLVRECYVHGIMEGESFGMVDRNEVKVEVLEIQ